MRLIRQRRENDCGVAVVAMVAGVSYQRALAAFTPEVRRRMTSLRAGTSTRDVANALVALGWQCDARLRPLRKRDLDALTGRAILCVRYPEKGAHTWHWCAFLGEKSDMRVLDPATQLKPYVVTSYLGVWK